MTIKLAKVGQTVRFNTETGNDILDAVVEHVHGFRLLDLQVDGKSIRAVHQDEFHPTQRRNRSWHWPEEEREQ